MQDIRFGVCAVLGLRRADSEVVALGLCCTTDRAQIVRLRERLPYVRARDASVCCVCFDAVWISEVGSELK